MPETKLRFQADNSAFPARLIHLAVSQGDRVIADQNLAVVESAQGIIELKASAKGEVSSILLSPGQELNTDDVILVLDYASMHLADDGKSARVLDSKSANGYARVFPRKLAWLALALFSGTAVAALGYFHYADDLPYIAAERWPALIPAPQASADKRWRLESGGTVPALRVSVVDALWTLRIEPSASTSTDAALLNIINADDARLSKAQVVYGNGKTYSLSFLKGQNSVETDLPLKLKQSDIRALIGGNELVLQTSSAQKISVSLKGTALAIHAARRAWRSGDLSTRNIDEQVVQRRRSNRPALAYHDPWPTIDIPGDYSSSNNALTVEAASPDRAPDLRLDAVEACAKLSKIVANYEESVDKQRNKLRIYERQKERAEDQMSTAQMLMSLAQSFSNNSSYNQQVNNYNRALNKRREAIRNYNNRVDSTNSYKRKLNRAVKKYNKACNNKSFLIADIEEVCAKSKLRRTVFCKNR